ncbi:MAG: MBL fold metallo-hydrolase, partial [Actinobacteria bacterium]|nr:MBL fold metallo-hydrolase [Actinomycetota bacterium]
MQITVLGKSPSWQDVDGACSGYLVEEAGAAIVLDCGNGVFGKLRRYRDYCAIDAVVISHLHADHFLDLVPFAYALTYTPRRDSGDPARPQLHAPRGARETFRRVVGAWGNEDLIEAAFDLHEYEADSVLEIASLEVRFHS